MRKVIGRLLWAAFLLVQDGPMPITVTMDDGQTYRVDVVGDPEEAILRIQGREGEFGNGWMVESGGTHLNIDHAVKMRAYDKPPRAAGFN